MGMDSEYTEILGIKVPVMTIPVKPGRNLAIIIEVAAMNNRQKKMGYNAAYELLSALGMDASMMPHEEIKRDLDISQHDFSIKQDVLASCSGSPFDRVFCGRTIHRIVRSTFLIFW